MYFAFTSFRNWIIKRVSIQFILIKSCYRTEIDNFLFHIAYVVKNSYQEDLALKCNKTKLVATQLCTQTSFILNNALIKIYSFERLIYDPAKVRIWIRKMDASRKGNLLRGKIYTLAFNSLLNSTPLQVRYVGSIQTNQLFS